jgi:hypothetical protein
MSSPGFPCRVPLVLHSGQTSFSDAEPSRSKDFVSPKDAATLAWQSLSFSLEAILGPFRSGLGSQTPANPNQRKKAITRWSLFPASLPE